MRHRDHTTQPVSDFSDGVFVRERGHLCASCVPDLTSRT
jgi:hypothetical protein